MSTVCMSIAVGQRTSYHPGVLWLACLSLEPFRAGAHGGDMALRQELQDHQAAI